MHTLFDLSGKIAVVSCCASDIGRSMAGALAEAGADIVGIDKNSLADTEASVRAYGRQFYGISADLSNTGEIPGIMSNIISKHGKIDILIAYANEKGSAAEPEEISWDEYLDIVDANQNAITRLSTLAYSQMLKQEGGKIVIVSSVLADRMASNTLAYTVTKNAVIGLMRTLSIAGARHNIWVNAIAPGIIETSAVRGHKEIIDEINAVIERKGLGSMKMPLGKPAHLRGAAVFLSSKASDYIVGEIFRIDGGFTTRI